MTGATFLVFGGTGQTGRHVVELALRDGHRVRVLARDPSKVARRSPRLDVVAGSVADVPDLDELVRGVDHVVAMLGDVETQRTTKVNTAFVEQLVPAMRRHGIRRFLYQAGALSTPPGGRLPPYLWAIRKTLPSGYRGQHEDNEAVMRYLVDTAEDIEWVVHRAGIGSDGPSRGVLERSATTFSVATFRDCAAYSYRMITDPSAVHTCDLSTYATA